jgi:hypothetical protein
MRGEIVPIGRGNEMEVEAVAWGGIVSPSDGVAALRPILGVRRGREGIAEQKVEAALVLEGKAEV